MTVQKLLIVAIALVAVTAIICTALSPSPIVAAAIGAIVLQIAVGLLNLLKAQNIGEELAQNTAATKEIAAVVEIVPEKLAEIHDAANGAKEEAVKAARVAGILQGKAIEQAKHQNG